jgi:hypothetical protein
MGLVMAGYEIKLILMSLFYFWFTLDAPLRADNPKSVDTTDAFSHMTPIIDIIKAALRDLPEPELTPEIKALNQKMQSLKEYLPDPETLDKVSKEKAQQQTEHINKSIHTVSCDLMQQDVHLEAVANALFNYWLRFSVYFGVSESDWQKMDYYFPKLLGSVRAYLSATFTKDKT